MCEFFHIDDLEIKIKLKVEIEEKYAAISASVDPFSLSRRIVTRSTLIRGFEYNDILWIEMEARKRDEEFNFFHYY